MKEVPVHPRGVLVVDDEDYPVVRYFRWHLGGSGMRYPFTMLPAGVHRQGVRMYLPHLLLGGDPNGLIIYRDGDTLNNRRENIVRAHTSVPQHRSRWRERNTSGYRGVHWRADKGRWAAAVMKDRRVYRLGYFDDPVEAAKEYDRKARELYGPLALTNEDLGNYPWQRES